MAQHKSKLSLSILLSNSSILAVLALVMGYYTWFIARDFLAKLV